MCVYGMELSYDTGRRSYCSDARKEYYSNKKVQLLSTEEPKGNGERDGGGRLHVDSHIGPLPYGSISNTHYSPT